MNRYLTVLNYGGGVQTVAMCVLVLREILPRPDWIVAADTGREAQGTWDYLRGHIQPRLDKIGLRVNIAPHSLAACDLYSRSGQLPIIPAFTSTAMLRNWCSGEWKHDVIRRWLRAQGVRAATNWIGFTLDERRRLPERPDAGPWVRTFLLIDLMLTRANCEQIILDAGLPLPAKSACFICPYRSNEEWRQIRDRYPDQWDLAIKVDTEIREADDRGELWLHHSRVPLADADLEMKAGREPSRQCGLGTCFV